MAVPLDTESVDVVVSQEAHIPDRRRALGDAFQVLKKGVGSPSLTSLGFHVGSVVDLTAEWAIISHQKA